MNREDVIRLQAVTGTPAVSVLIPTHRTSPDNQQDPIRVRNSVRDAIARLTEEYGAREMSQLTANLEAIAEDVDYEHALDGLAIFVSDEVAEKHYLPYPVRERIVIGETFATRDLVLAMNRSPRYWVLALSEQPTRLYEGDHTVLTEVNGHGFPMTHNGAGGAVALNGGHGLSPSKQRDEAQRVFFRSIDEALGEVLSEDPLPVILAGIDRNHAFYQEITQHGASIVGTMTGSHDRTSPHELAELAWPVMEEAQAQRRAEDLEAFGNAIGAQKYASGIDDSWRLASEGRAEVVLVEEDYHFAGRLEDEGLRIVPVDDPDEEGVIEDVVDELVELVIARGGRAVFVPNGALEEHHRVGLILRY
ncbi:MAG: hypothetical protein O2798_00990 [Chloroflexi bacterium]|nr:hypothetical protein [Chloroflexota bacterium]MDA1239397.1 hypothetical protein [Chloroflexota bacterium]